MLRKLHKILHNSLFSKLFIPLNQPGMVPSIKTPFLFFPIIIFALQRGSDAILWREPYRRTNIF